MSTALESSVIPPGNKRGFIKERRLFWFVLGLGGAEWRLWDCQSMMTGPLHRRAGGAVPELRAVTRRAMLTTGVLMTALLGSVFSLWRRHFQMVSVPVMWWRCALLTGTLPFSTPSRWRPFSPRTQGSHMAKCIVQWWTGSFKVSSSTGSSHLHCYLDFFSKTWVRVCGTFWQSPCLRDGGQRTKSSRS